MKCKYIKNMTEEELTDYIEQLELETEAEELLQPWIYSKADNPTGDIYTEKQLHSKTKYEIPSSSFIEDTDPGHRYNKNISEDKYSWDSLSTETLDEAMIRLKLTERQKEIAIHLDNALTDTERGMQVQITQDELAKQLGITQQGINKLIKLLRNKMNKQGIKINLRPS